MIKHILLSLLVCPFVIMAAPPTPPNIVVIYCDDLGFGDLACYGNPAVKTPRLDAMAREGLRMTRFYSVQGVCSASRSGLMTGCYPNRVGIRGALGPNSPVGLDPEETTLAEVLKARGYATGIFGKWHLGDRPKFRPIRQGFDEWVGIPYSNDMWPPRHGGEKVKDYPSLPWMHNDTVERELDQPGQQANFTRDLTDATLAFIRKNAEAKTPFFAYFPSPMPHVPLATSAEFTKVSQWGPIGDVVEEIDHSVGRILDTLRELGLDENTLVVFSSDNGPWLNFGDHAGSTGGLREGKGTSFEGGVRVPGIFRWPGRIAPGVNTNQVAATIDLLPTLALLTGAPLPERKIDGVDLRPLLLERDPAWQRPPLFIHYSSPGPHDQLQAVISGDWKLVLPHKHRHYLPEKAGRNGMPGPTATLEAPLALYHLSADPAEATDVQSGHPDILKKLQALADAHWAEITANARPVGRAGRE